MQMLFVLENKFIKKMRLLVQKMKSLKVNRRKKKNIWTSEQDQEKKID